MACHYFQKKGLFLTDNVIFEKRFFQLVQNFYEVNWEKQYWLQDDKKQ